MASPTTDPCHLIIDQMPDGAAIVSAEGLLRYANEGLARMLGRDVSSGRALAELVVAGDQGALADLLAVESGGRRSARIRLDAANGPLRTLFVTSRPGQDDSLLCLITALDDDEESTEERTARAELLAGTLEALPVGVYVVDPDATSVYANREALRILGLPGLPRDADEAVDALNLVDVNTGKPYARERIPLEQALAGHAAHAIDAEIRDEPDQVIPVELWGTPVFGPDDEVRFAIATVADITARARAEEVLTGQAHVLDLAHDAVIIWNPTGRVMYWNGGAETMYGYSKEQAVGRRVHEMLSTRFPTPLEEILRLVHTEGRWEGELEQRRSDGSGVIVDSRWAPHVDLHGCLLGIMELNRDATRRKEAEAALAQRAAELEVANRDISRSNEDLEQFAYVASHDLAEPLRAIELPLTMVAQRYQGQLGEDADECIAFAVDGCRRMQKMIDDLLRWSRVGRLEEGMAAVDCTEVVAEVLERIGTAIDDADATVLVGDLPTVWGERSQISQVFQNLIANAVKFVEPDVSPIVEIAARPAGHLWRITVTDNGIGVAPNQRQRIFGMFKRLHAREKYSGTGIGLAMAKKVVERHGGSIGVEEAPSGQGCRFWFTLPSEPAR